MHRQTDFCFFIAEGENAARGHKPQPRAARRLSTNSDQKTVQALDRAMDPEGAGRREGMSLTELAEASGQAPATVYRVLSTYQAHGMVEVQPATQLWFVGQEAFRIGSAFLGRTNLVEQARMVMRELMSDTGETANLAIADGGQVVFLSQVETHEPIRAFFRPGTRGPIHASGIGKALLAYLPEAAVERIVREQGLPAFTARTITDRGKLVEEMAGVRGGAGRWTTRSAPRACAASPRRSSTSSARRWPGCRSRGRWCGWTGSGAAASGARVRAAADRITEAIGGTAP